MRENLVKSEEFKDSRFNVPSGWQLTTLGQISRIRRGASPRPIDSPEWFADDGSGWVRITDVTRSNGRLRTTEQRLSPKGVAKSVPVKPGQLIMSICATIGEPAIVEIDVCIHDGFVVFDQYENCLDTQFLYHFLRYWTPNFRGYGQTGTQANLNTDIVGTTSLLLPPKEEQQQIAEILDTIDSTIAHTSSLIAKLKQMKAGLLHDLLTRGLDENGELRDAIGHPEQFKDSPLGRIPKDWLVVSVGECLARIEQGWSPDCESNNTPLGEWGVLKTTAVVWEGYQDFENKQLPSHLQPDPNYEVKPGDVLMTRAGPNSRVGVVALVRQTQGKLMLSDKLYRLIPRDYVKPDFLAYTLSGNQTQGHLSTLKTGLAESQTNISQEIVRTLLIALPKIQEQERIISILDTHDSHIRTEEAYRDKLKLQKQGLMHDLLTGMIRVKDT